MKFRFYHINNLVVDPYFKDFLLSSENKINRMFLSVETLTDINFLAPSDKPDMVSYLPANKLKKVQESGGDVFLMPELRSNIKVGRLVSKLWTPQTLYEFQVTPKDIEAFVNSYKSFFNLDRVQMRVVEGVEIKKWYLCTNYESNESGTLWKSCMRYREKQPFLSLYSLNPDSVKMLIMTTKLDDGREVLRARALLWQEAKSNSSSLKVMDRIYTIYDSDVLVFKRWATENGYISKSYQNSKSTNIFDVDGQDLVLNLSVKLKNHLLDSYPYLDSFQFYNQSNGLFSNTGFSNFDYILNRANGRLIDDEEEEDQVVDYDDE